MHRSRFMLLCPLFFTVIILFSCAKKTAGFSEEKLLNETDPSEIVRQMESHFKRPCAYVPYVTGNMVVDGRLNEPGWKEAMPLPMVFINGTDGTPTQETDVRVITDQHFVYVGFQIGRAHV